MRRFLLTRTTGAAGFLAEGVAFSDGTVALRSMAAPRYLAFHPSIDAAIAVSGDAHLRWIDPPVITPKPREARHRA